MECISLPEDLVEEILYRVPLKSVARWRSTSKQWNALLKSKRFLKTHAAYAPKLFPEATTRSSIMRPTYVLWDMSDYSIPENFHPCLVKKQIESAIEKEGNDGDLSIWVYGAENTWSTELENQFWEVGFEVNPYKGGKSTRLNLVIGEFMAVLYAMNDPSNVLTLAENTEYIEQHPKFLRFRKVLEDKGFFVALAHPDTLINQDHSALMSAYFPSAWRRASPLPDFPPLPLPDPPSCNYAFISDLT